MKSFKFETSEYRLYVDAKSKHKTQSSIKQYHICHLAIYTQPLLDIYNV